jgi:hypothetical protein
MKWHVIAQGDVIGGCAVQWCNGKVIFVAVLPEGVDTLLRGF